MSYVAVNFQLPTSTVPFPSAGRCKISDVKRSTKTIRPAAPRTRLVLVHPKGGPQHLSGFWDTLLNGSVKLFQATTGVPVPGLSKSPSAAAPAQKGAPAAPQQQLGPLANVSTSTLVVGSMAFSALLLVLAHR